MKTVYVEQISDIKPGQLNQLSNYTHKVDVICGELLKLGVWASVSHDKKYGYNYAEVLTNPTHDQILSQLSASHDKGPDSIRIINCPDVPVVTNYTFYDGILYRNAGRSKCQWAYSRIGALSVGESMSSSHIKLSLKLIEKYFDGTDITVRRTKDNITKLSGVNTVEIELNAN